MTEGPWWLADRALRDHLARVLDLWVEWLAQLEREQAAEVERPECG